MSYAEHLIEQYLPKGLLLDANLLLLHLVGLIDPSLIGHGKRLADFDLDDFVRLEFLISLFKRHATTAHVLTEVSNLINTGFSDYAKFALWSRFVEHLEVFEEQAVASYSVAASPEFCYLGLTDAVLSTLTENFLLVSADFRMVNLLRDRGLNAVKWVEVQGF